MNDICRFSVCSNKRLLCALATKASVCASHNSYPLHLSEEIQLKINADYELFAVTFVFFNVDVPPPLETLLSIYGVFVPLLKYNKANI